MSKRARLAARITVPLGIAAAVVATAAGPALAAASLTVTQGGSSVAGSTLTQNGTLKVSGSDTAPDRTGLGAKRTLTLTVTIPSGTDVSLDKQAGVASNQAGSVSGSVDSSCPSWSNSPCTQAANGDYDFTFSNGSSTQTTTVTYAVPPSDVGSLAGSASGTVATFRWPANNDNVPDFAGYVISGGGSDVRVGVDACDSSACSVSIDYGSGAQGQTDSFGIRALRAKAPGSSGTVPSADAATTSVSFPAPASSSSGGGSSGSAGASGSGTGGGSASGSGSGGAATGSGGASSAGHGSASGAGHSTGPVITGKHPGATLTRFLPTTSAGAAPDLPSVLTEIRPLPQGTYRPTLAYPDQTLSNAIRKPAPQAIDKVGTDIVRVLNLTQLWTSLAGAAIVLLIAAHLRAWVEGIDLSD